MKLAAQLLVLTMRLAEFTPVYADSVLGSLYHMDVGSTANVLEVYAASIFRVEVNRISQCLCIYRFWSNRLMRGRVGLLLGPR
jgi:hypothetical protein